MSGELIVQQGAPMSAAQIKDRVQLI